MAWSKLGLVFDLNVHGVEWIKSHALMPLPILINDRLFVYYTSRSLDGKSRIGFVELSPDDPTKVIYVSPKPLFDVGKVGTFDDCGTVCTCVLQHLDKVLLYYNGYNVRNTVPWSNSIGLSVSVDNGLSFEKFSEGPIMDRGIHDPYFTISPSVLIDDDVWHMWYTSGTGWLMKGDKPEPLYHIKYASSEDNGITWNREGVSCILPDDKEEAVARATVIKENNLFKMWFCYRGSEDFRDGSDSYRIGYAEADVDDPTQWTRKDSLAGISLGPEEYDDKMQAYPAVINMGGKKYLFYNGNGFGAQGFCCAVWED